jgi:hypothetical protein
MKTILVLVSAFAMTASAFAMPNVGDEAMYAASMTQNGQTQTGTVDFKLMSNDASTNSWSEQITTTVGGQSTVQTNTVTGDELVNDGQVQGILANCAAANGTLQTITVPAGTFNTCELSANDAASGTTGNVWIGEASFGIIQEDMMSADGKHSVMQLQSQEAGQ